MDEDYSNIRKILGHLIGQRLLEITQHEKQEFLEGKDSFVELMFENGDTLKFFVADESAYKSGFPFCYSDPDKTMMDDIYVPSEEDAAEGKWAVVQWNTDAGRELHVMPNFGKHHIFDESCWCGTRKEIRSDGVPMIYHEQGAE